MNEPTALQIKVALLPSRLELNQYVPQATAVVIDTLRFTTCAASALTAGATSIHVEPSIERAIQRRASVPPPALLCGERHCRPIPGFDLGNSPAEYTPERVSGHALIFTTTNGTRAVEAVANARCIYLACLGNRSAIAGALLKHHHASAHPILIICAGTEGEVAEEDVLVAGAILDAMNRSHECNTNDAGQEAVELWRTTTRGLTDQEVIPEIVRLFRTTRGGRNLLRAGYEDDLWRAAQIDTLETTPVRSGGTTFFVNGEE
ncbi:MAG: 2-phosphosulfolactate phosphatase [Pirellulaceae bacterium]|nr:MAG: 2-phosphosulfolactate phosphatase [Pirellulaceae bacterium]